MKGRPSTGRRQRVQK